MSSPVETTPSASPNDPDNSGRDGVTARKRKRSPAVNLLDEDEPDPKRDEQDDDEEDDGDGVQVYERGPYGHDQGHLQVPAAPVAGTAPTADPAVMTNSDPSHASPRPPLSAREQYGWEFGDFRGYMEQKKEYNFFQSVRQKEQGDGLY